MSPTTPSDRRRRDERRRTFRRRRLAAAGVLAAAGIAVWAAVASTGGGRDASAAAGAGATTGTSPAPVPPPAPAPARARVRVDVVGDIVMGSPPYGLPPDGGASLFRPVRSMLTGDVVLGNLEGTLASGGSSKCSPGSSSCFAFRTPPSYARWLKRAGFTVMNMANNHAFDFGATGERETVDALDRAGLLHTGRPGEVARQPVGGVRVALLGFAPYPWANSLTDIPAAGRLIAKAARQADIVIVMIHAGAEGSDKTHVRPGPETFLGEPRGDSMAFARAAVDAGADLVVGSGPHVMRGMQFRRGRLIAYSMGNFAGYKVFSLRGNSSTSGVLQVTLGADGRFVSGRIVPTQLVGAGTPAPGGSGIGLVASLSREDFGATGARVAADGTIQPPA
jgi:poly-gamma-glutamate capsule biosynthesis protein CapA/YwtB (metallophosphatase superfamily)